MARTLSDKAWADICAAAKPHTPDDGARAALSKVLFEDYPGFVAYDPARERERRERAERMLKHLDAFRVEYCAEFEPTDDAVRTGDVKIRIKPDLWCLEGLRQRAAFALHEARRRQRANSGKQNERRAVLYGWLCDIWLDHFGGELTYYRPAGEPEGPLVEFILTAMRQVMPKAALPKREAVRNNIDRERDEHEKIDRDRENFFQRLALQARNRAVVD